MDVFIAVLLVRKDHRGIIDPHLTSHDEGIVIRNLNVDGVDLVLNDSQGILVSDLGVEVVGINTTG